MAFLGRREIGRQLMMPHERRVITEQDIARASAILREYKSGKANLEQRVVEDELWYEMRHWEVIRRDKAGESPEPSSGWLFNSILNKHADAMDNRPDPLVLPRERGDEKDARALSSILPVILERREFEQTYSDDWWEKLKHGTAVYAVTWNPELENGLGDIDIQAVDLLNIYWEPGIADIQKSRNVFTVELVDTDILESRYPEHTGKLGGGAEEITRYVTGDQIKTDGKSLVVNWYYKLRAASGQTLVHYVRFCGDRLLFASENAAGPDGDYPYQERGYYDHGKYPFVFDVLFPEKGSPAGFGYVALCKSPQLYIDKLDANILETSLLATKARFFVSEGTDVNEGELKDLSKSIVHVAGRVEEDRLRQISVAPLPSIYATIQQNKIAEMKETSSNRDFAQGGASSGVTAASAIVALQEAGNKVSRDMIAASYRAYRDIGYLVIELIRQFYDEARTFRIMGGEQYRFVDYSNAGIRDQMTGVDSAGNPLFRRPVFDIRIIPQKKNPLSVVAQNEQAKELYQLGVFAPENAQQASCLLSMMQFDGIDKVRELVAQGQTLYNLCNRLMAQIQPGVQQTEQQGGGQAAGTGGI